VERNTHWSQEPELVELVGASMDFLSLSVNHRHLVQVLKERLAHGESFPEEMLP
jgi:hypothetical protein